MRRTTLTAGQLALAPLAVLLLAASAQLGGVARGADELAPPALPPAEVNRLVNNYLERLAREQLRAANAERQRRLEAPVLPMPAPPAPAMPAGPVMAPPAPVSPVVPAPPVQPAVVPAPAADQAAFARYTHLDGGFSVELPGKPRVFTVNTAQDLPVHQMNLVTGGIEYAMAYSDVASESMDQFNNQDAFYAYIRNNLETNFGVRADHQCLTRVAGRTACEIELTIPDGRHFIDYVFLVGNRLYQVSIIGDGLRADHPLVERYRDSFELLR